jgi:threonine dehydratase
MPEFDTDPPLIRDSVIEAAELIKRYIHVTPVHTSKTLDLIASTPQSPETLADTEWTGQHPAKPKIRLFFKCENYQKIGAFKARGAFHAVSRLAPEQRSKGVITHSSGDPINARTTVHMACMLTGG